MENGIHTRYTLTAVKKSGLRELASQNTGRYNYLTKEDAERQLKAILENNSPSDIAEIIGTDLRVDPVECYHHGDATRTIF